MSPKVWLITGASVGLGRALTEQVLENGDIAVATLRKPEVIADLSAKYPASKLLVLRLDVSKESEITATFEKVKETFGRLDVVVNNAGYGALGEVEGTPLEVARGIFEVNFWGAGNVAREAVKFFREVNKPQGGRLLHITSMAGVEANPGIGYYSASKHASEGLLDAFSKELNPAWNIKITIIEPGGFETRGTKPESLVQTPQHPAYAFEGSMTSMVRGYIPVATMPGDTNKAAKAMYKIAYDANVPLRVPLGLDGIAAVLRKSASLKEDAEKVGAYSEDLKLEA